MYISYANALNLPILFANVRQKVADVALVDSGATENFLDRRTVKRWGLGTRKLSQPRQVFNVDGTENREGTLTEYCLLRCVVGGKDALQRFYVTNLGHDRVLLGYPWLSTFNPRIDWTSGKVGEGEIRIESQWKKHLNLRPQLVKHQLAMTKIDQTTTHPSNDVAWWERLRKALKGHVQNKLATVIKKTHVAQEWAIEAHKKCLVKGEKLEELPHQYQKFADIFDEEKSHRFPPS